ncbi:hypothetical protein [Candidatus Odyssella acanthamoebae]|uniref:Uncharacterized protein n=1 Tax=Candidatus Odyssella acanthamoebae TaxID=91604 RepID=A0A077B108_9PROT|nr:hypothetical protein [Candidatus Paracaedibacter acanthamoebae]AIK96630.1 hypothetical protein ID47_07720 [Candidatus Paracaedibacter acanthamoebae]
MNNRAPDTLAAPPATSSNISWTLCQPYWGEDNYVTIRWNGTSEDKKYVAFQIYEWIGKWIQVSINNLTVPGSASYFMTEVYDFGDSSTGADYYTRVAMGSGKFMVALTNVDTNNTLLFHRDANTPGLWNVTPYYLGKALLPTVPSNYTKMPVDCISFNYIQLCLDVGNNIASLLDVINGTLYLFSLVNNAWVLQNEAGITVTESIQWVWAEYLDLHYINRCSSFCVVGDDVLVFTNVTPPITSSGDYNNYPAACNTYYQLFHYDKIAESSTNAWSAPLNSTPLSSSASKIVIPWLPWAVSVIDDLEGGFVNGGSNVAGITCELADGFVFVQIIVDYLPVTDGTTLVGRPLVVSWDDKYKQLNIQQIYSPNNASKYTSSSSSMFWGDTLQQTSLPTQGDLSGTIASSNLINISTGSGSPQKYVARYVGGTALKDSGYNYGWYCDSGLSNLSDNSDLWEQMASFDTTIAINKGSSEVYTYQFYQFQPYLAVGQEDPGPGWTLQSTVNMGTNKDWADIEHIIQEVDFFVKLALRAAIFIASFGESFIASEAIRGALECVKVTLRFSKFALNNRFVA